MKRTDRYRDSYQYDNQNQNHRRQSEDASYRQQYAKGDPEEHPAERYYNGRDYQENKFLKKKTRKSRRSKNGYISLLPLIIVANFLSHAPYLTMIAIKLVMTLKSLSKL